MLTHQLKYMLKYFTSILLFSVVYIGFAQENQGQLDLSPKDTTYQYREEYGLRFGVDLSRPILSFTNGNEYTGLEFVADYRLSEKLFIAGEFGNEKKTKQEDLYNFTTNGSYIKLGLEANNYVNWYGEQNFITFGGRYGFATFSQTLNSYSIYDSNRYFNPDSFAEVSTTPEEFSSLNASWIEAVLGFKAELFANIYLGASVRLGHLISNKEAERFPNLFIPGFNKVTDNAKWGVGYNYSISYFLPIYKKVRKKQDETEVSN